MNAPRPPNWEQVRREIAEVRIVAEDAQKRSEDATEDLTEWVKRLDRPRQPSVHEFVTEMTGVQGTDSTPPLLALAQKAWWRVAVTVAKVGLGAALGAAIHWLWTQAHGG